MQRYTIHIDEDGGHEPLILSVLAASDARALELAREHLARSSDRLAARISRGAEPLFEITRETD